MEIVLISAVAENGVIGHNNGMPWHYPSDLEHFEDCTMGSPVVMGRVTYESIVEQNGGPLSGRQNIVLSRQQELPILDVETDSETEVHHVSSRMELTSLFYHSDRRHDVVYIAGGQSVYEQFLPIADRMVITHIHREYEGDSYFPGWDEDRWDIVSDKEGEGPLSFVTYEC